MVVPLPPALIWGYAGVKAGVSWLSGGSKKDVLTDLVVDTVAPQAGLPGNIVYYQRRGEELGSLLEREETTPAEVAAAANLRDLEDAINRAEARVGIDYTQTISLPDLLPSLALGADANVYDQYATAIERAGGGTVVREQAAVSIPGIGVGAPTQAAVNLSDTGASLIVGGAGDPSGLEWWAQYGLRRAAQAGYGDEVDQTLIELGLHPNQIAVWEAMAKQEELDVDFSVLHTQANQVILGLTLTPDRPLVMDNRGIGSLQTKIGREIVNEGKYLDAHARYLTRNAVTLGDIRVTEGSWAGQKYDLDSDQIAGVMARAQSGSGDFVFSAELAANLAAAERELGQRLPIELLSAIWEQRAWSPEDVDLEDASAALQLEAVVDNTLRSRDEVRSITGGRSSITPGYEDMMVYLSQAGTTAYDYFARGDFRGAVNDPEAAQEIQEFRQTALGGVVAETGGGQLLFQSFERRGGVDKSLRRGQLRSALREEFGLQLSDDFYDGWIDRAEDAALQATLEWGETPDATVAVSEALLDNPFVVGRSALYGDRTVHSLGRQIGGVLEDQGADVRGPLTRTAGLLGGATEAVNMQDREYARQWGEALRKDGIVETWDEYAALGDTQDEWEAHVASEGLSF